MRTSVTQLLDTLRLSKRFLDEHAGVLAGIPGTAASRALNEGITNLSALAAEQDSHRTRTIGALMQERTLAREFRRQWLNPIVRIARANRAKVPQFAVVVLPPSRTSTSQVVARARAIVDVITPFKALFLDHGMPADFVERMEHAAAVMTSAAIDKGDSRQSRVKATDSIKKTARDAARALSVLDTLVKARLNDSEPLVRAWRDVSRVISSGPKKAATPIPVTTDSEAVAKAA